MEIAAMCIFFFKQKFSNTDVTQNPHNPIAKDLKLTKCVLSNEKKKQKISGDSAYRR